MESAENLINTQPFQHSHPISKTKRLRSNKSQFEGIEKNTTYPSNQVTILKQNIYKTVQTDVLNRMKFTIHPLAANK